MALKYPRGTVVLVSQVPDKKGVNPKDRPVILLRDVEDTEEVIHGVAVTSSFSHPLPASSVKLPYHRQGRCKTGLTVDCVADCKWIVAATPENILKRTGFTPPIELLKILEQVATSLPPPPPTSPATEAGE